MITKGKLVLLMSDVLPNYGFKSKLNEAGFDFETVQLSHFLAHYSKYKDALLLMPSLFLEIVDINLDSSSDKSNYQFIVFSNRLKGAGKIDSNSTDFTILDRIEYKSSIEDIKKIVDNHL